MLDAPRCFVALVAAIYGLARSRHAPLPSVVCVTPILWGLMARTAASLMPMSWLTPHWLCGNEIILMTPSLLSSARAASLFCNWILALIDALHQKQFFIATETNGTLLAPPDIDWLTVSPKAGSRLMQRHGDELKIVMPQEHWSWRDCQKIRERGHFRHCFIQPNDDGRQLRHMAHIMTYCNRHPSWRMSLQLHKLWNIP